jgi:type IV pilus assembly protein PilY1
MTRTTRQTLRRAAPCLALAALLLAGLPVRADDTALFSTRVPPNVVFVFDNSQSMNHVVWHPAFRPDVEYDTVNCPYIADPSDPDYDPKCLEHPLCTDITTSDDILGSDGSWNLPEGYYIDNGGSVDRCLRTRLVYNDPEVDTAGNKTIWDLKYLQWYFSENTNEDPDGDGTSIYADIIATANGTTSTCLVNEGYAATYSKYRRARVTAAKQITHQVICETSAVADLRYGLAKFYTRLFLGFIPLDPDGGFVHKAVSDYTSAHAAALEGAIDATEGDTLTPLAETLYNVYRYFMLRTAGEQAVGKDDVTLFPAYDIRETGVVSSTSIPASPVTHTCQKHFVVMLTDGEPTWDDFDDEVTPNSSSPLKPIKSDWTDKLIGDYYMPGDECEEGCSGYSREESWYLDDVAHFMHTRDFLPTAAHPGTQTLDVYTVGFTTNAAANDILRRTAQRGGGEFYTSNNPEELAQAMTGAINSIVSKAKSFTSAAVPASRTTSGDNFYSAFFVPQEDTPFWQGHLKNFDFSAAGDVLTADGHCAVGVDPNANPPCAAIGALRTTAIAFWDAATAMPDPDDRRLYLEFGDTPIFAQPDSFAIPATPSDAVPWFGIVSADNTVAPYSSLSPSTTTDMASALIRNLRGCTFSNSSTCTPRLDPNNDPLYLGDIFHSNPVVVGSPNSAINEGSYQAFANTWRDRPRVIYAGANDGFLHAFHAGDWQTLEADGVTPLIPPRHDRGTGEELFGFMPYGVRNTVKELLKHTSGLRTQVNVDGSPVVADVWFNRTVSGGVLTSADPVAVAKQEEQWRTVLIQGLRDGGQHYSALDVTDPPADVTVSTTSYPRYLWAFPCEDCANAVNGGTSGETTYMGNTWSEPVITRVRVKSDTGSDPHGYERWVAIFGAGYHPHGDPNGSGYKVPTDAGFEPKGRAIYMVDITTGEVLARKHFDASATSLDLATGEQEGILELRYAFASSPAVFDLDFDGFADVVYIGDLGGNLWKWVITAPGQDPIHNTTTNDDPAQPDWPFRLFFRGSASTEPPAEHSGGAWDSSVHYQSFFFPPTGALREGKLVLAFGAGERADPIGTLAEWNDGLLTNNNHYYVVKDSDPLERVGTLPNRLTDAFGEGNLADFDASTPLTCSQMMSTTEGYYVTGRDSEKFVSNSTILFGTVFTGSFLPSDPSATSTCDGKGTSYLYAFDLDCGVGEFTSNPTAQDDRRMAIGTGIPTRPRVSVGDLNQGDTGGCTNKVVVVTSDGEIWNDCPGPMPSSGVQVRSWRER